MYKYSNSDIILKFKKIHGDRYDYSTVVYAGINTKVEITCRKHGIFLQTPHNHIYKKGCSKCAKKYMDTEYFKIVSNQKHNNYYNYNQTNFISAKKQVIITCPIHGDFKQTPDSHLRGCGCFKCKGSVKKTTDDFILESKKAHGDLYDYSKSHYEGINKKIDIICSKHGLFKQRPIHHINGVGCPICCESKGEKLIREFLIQQSIVFIPQFTFKKCIYKKKLPFDFFLPELNTCIEFDGLQHKIEVKQFGGKEGLILRNKKDSIKNKFCQDNSIDLIRINYNQIDEISQILESFLSSIILTKSSKIE